MLDDTNITGLRSVTLSATSPLFGVGTALIQLLDNETPPVPYQPIPPDQAVGVSLDTALSWRGGVGEIVVNSGFETGDFKGWIQQNFDYGFFVINNGLFDPDGPDGPLVPSIGMAPVKRSKSRRPGTRRNGDQIKKRTRLLAADRIRMASR